MSDQVVTHDMARRLCSAYEKLSTERSNLKLLDEHIKLRGGLNATAPSVTVEARSNNIHRLDVPITWVIIRNVVVRDVVHARRAVMQLGGDGGEEPVETKEP